MKLYHQPIVTIFSESGPIQESCPSSVSMLMQETVVYIFSMSAGKPLGHGLLLKITEVILVAVQFEIASDTFLSHKIIPFCCPAPDLRDTMEKERG